ncbi:GGDEF domain-containing protein [Rhodoligotrophos ferricapiens]|uniref:GGDEF domain-containing protein n=1 Tax=Rhodoligotrophos ferricapiens TaxID=3069264 RepID=UPI00315C9A08
MDLDIYTVLVLLIAVCSVITVVLVVAWHNDPSARSYFWWSAGCLSGAVGLSLILWRDRVADTFAVDLANTLLLIGAGMGWVGLRVLYGRPVTLLHVITPVLPWLLGLVVMGPDDQPWERTVWLSIASAGICLAIAYEFWRGRGERLPSSRPLAALILLDALFYIVRGVMAFLAPMPDSMGRTGLWFGVSLVEAMLFLVAVAVFGVALIREQSERRLKLLAMRDPLTRSLNRRGFFEMAPSLMAQSPGSYSSVIIFDIDSFKLINDQFGHPAGDELLSSFARRLAELLPARSLLCRLGGEEFAVLLPGMSANVAVAVGEEVRNAIAEHAFAYDGTRLRVTVSAGIASQRLHDEADLDRLLIAADRALYEAKAAGRNRVRLNPVD